jgi:hypothetical protein
VLAAASKKSRRGLMVLFVMFLSPMSLVIFKSAAGRTVRRAIPDKLLEFAQ